MLTYIILMKLTDQGVKDIKNARDRIKEAVETLGALGGRMRGLYYVMGEYDFMTIIECPTEEFATIYLLRLGSLGNVRTTTLRAFGEEELGEMIEQLHVLFNGEQG